MVSTDCVNYAYTNPDISGVGVRISFYLQTFLLVLLVDRSWQDAPIALWTFIATSFGITLAAIVQREQLTLFQALQVSNLVWLANFGIFVALASYSRQKAASAEMEHSSSSSHHAFDYKVKYGAMAQTLFSMVLTMYMWAKARSFGNEPECSPFVKYMLFVVEVPVLETGRIVGLVISGILTAAYMWISLHELWSSYRSARNKKIRKRAGNEPHQHSSLGRAVSPTAESFVGVQHIQSPSLLTPPLASVPQDRKPVCSCRGVNHIPSEKGRVNGTSSLYYRPKRRRWSFDLDPMFVGIVICQVMVFTYFIVSSELLLKHNPSLNSTDGQWTFGQILALIVVIPSGLSVIGALSRHGLKRLSKRKKRGYSRKSKRLESV